MSLWAVSCLIRPHYPCTRHQGVVSGGRGSWWHTARPRPCSWSVSSSSSHPPVFILRALSSSCHTDCPLAPLSPMHLLPRQKILGESNFALVVLSFILKKILMFFCCLYSLTWGHHFWTKFIYPAESPMQLLTLHLVKMSRWWQRRLCSRDVYTARGVQGLGRSEVQTDDSATAYMLAHHAAARWIITE